MNRFGRSRLLRFIAATLFALAQRSSVALAAAPVYVAVTGAENPFDGIDVGGFATPALADLDADGDLDFLAGERLGAFFYFENTGTPQNPIFVARIGAENPLDGAIVDAYSWPAFADLDDDGDFDLVSGEHFGLPYYENTGTALSPVFVARTGIANPFAAIAGLNNPAPAFADLDDDGDLDLVAGGSDGLFRYFENTGTPLIPIFTERTGIENPIDGQGVGGFSTAALADADGDGDFDFVAGQSTGMFTWFENTGTAVSPIFTLRSGEASPLFGLDAGLFSTATFADLDDDGDADLISGVSTGKFAFFRAPEPGTAAMASAALLSLSSLAKRRERRALR
ncbi:MAG: FG-GAP-like repeat-containing protein [Proteobacteria bacterium]|nr:FG-GAP-like repeat-containing protein [Pseudomonadota bacterium]